MRGLIIAFLMTSLPAGAAKLSGVEVELEDGRYRLTSKTHFDATESQLFSVLTNYDLFTQFTSAFAESKNREPEENGRPRGYVW